jgi:membrane associated rhomboid family serine protease
MYEPSPLTPASGETADSTTKRHFGVRGSIEVVAVLVAANVAAFIVSLVAAGSLTSTVDSPIVIDGGLYGPAVDDGEWWRIVTSGFLQVGWGHLISNMTGLLVFGLALGNAIGPARLALTYAASLLGGSVLALLFSGSALTVGASGAVFGLAGACIVVSYLQRRVILLLFAGLWVAGNLVATFTTPGISVAGHLGGLAAGALLGRLFVVEPRRLRSDGASLAVGIVVSLILFALAVLVA